MEFVHLSGSKLQCFPFKRLDGRTEQLGLQVQETERKLKLLTLAFPPMNKCAGDENVRSSQSGKLKHEPVCLLHSYMCGGNKCPAPCFQEQPMLSHPYMAIKPPPYTQTPCPSPPRSSLNGRSRKTSGGFAVVILILVTLHLSPSH